MLAFSFQRACARTLLATALCGVMAGSVLAADEKPREAVISVSGEGQASAAPDMAVLSLSVLETAKTAREALTSNNAAMSKVLDALKKAGIADRDLQTSGFAVNPQYVYPDNTNGSNKPPELVGYQVANSLTVRVRDLARLGEIVDQAVTLGVNQGGGIQFANDNPDATLAEAGKKAVGDAIARAKTLTEAAGVKLGRVIEISENSGRSDPVPMTMMRASKAEADAVPIANGENSYNVTVNVTFAIDP